MRNSKRVLTRVVGLALFFALIISGNKTEAAEKSVIYTTFYPTQYFAERIGGDRVKVINPVPSDEDAIFWMPDTKIIKAYQRADMIIINGAEFEKWVSKVTLHRKKTINTAKPLKESFIYFEKSVSHSHGPAGAHSHQGLDGHTWVDPVNAKIQAEQIKKGLTKLMPQYSKEFEARFTGLTKDLDVLDAAFKELSEKGKGVPLLTSHPAYNYIAKRYNWNIHNLDLDPEEMPKSEVFEDIKNILKTHPAKYLVWESYPKEEIAIRMKAELGLESVEFSPCELMDKARIQNGEDYLKVMKQNIENLRKIFLNS